MRRSIADSRIPKKRRMGAIIAALLTLAWAGAMIPLSVAAEETKDDLGQVVLHQLETLRQMGSVLYIAAHPDDENTELLAYLSRGRDYRTAYLSLTRGDGGQNLLGPDIGDKLGVARTQELLAARHIDGARQFFSRANDFGFSKDYKETLSVWGKDEILSDMVRVIRQFRPDIIVTRFTPVPGGTHGHHTASAVLAEEAFKLAADSKVFPGQHLPPWQAKRIFWNVSRFQKEKAVGLSTLKINIGGKDPVTGESFVDIATRSRSMHKTQGFDLFKLPSDPPREESFYLLGGEPAEKDIMDGVDTTWARVPGGASIGKEIDELIAHFDGKNIGANVPALLNLRAELAELATKNTNNGHSKDPVVAEKCALLDKILQECLGLTVKTIVENPEVVPGESIHLNHIAGLAWAPPTGLTVRWKTVRYPTIKKEITQDVDLKGGSAISVGSNETIPAGTEVTQQYWLKNEGTPGLVQVDDANLIGTPENAPAFSVEDVFEIGNQKLVLSGEPLHFTAGNTTTGRRRLDVISPVSLAFTNGVMLFGKGDSKEATVEITAARAGATGNLKLEVPAGAGWKVEPASHSFHLNKAGDKAIFKFRLTAPKSYSSASIGACAEVGGAKYRTQRQVVSYHHLPQQLMQPVAKLRIVCLDLAIRGKTVGYLPGAGDSLPENLEQMGYKVKMLDDATLGASDLKELDAVVLGVRALNTRKSMDRAMPVLLSYVEEGGNLIVQYNRPDNLKTPKIAPFDLTISPDRVTDEKAKITFLQPDNPVLNSPNKLTEDDFDGWVQERGLYFPNKWDEHFTPILECNDPGEKPTQGALLVAKSGKGYFIYTGLAFFRQLPAGVPGAYRLLANMIATGH